jgi:hypothetical protein
VNADGSGASGNFLPCLTFRTITGAIIARCPAPEVVAGDAAEVSWFPSVGSASSSSGAGAVGESCYVWGINGGSLTVASGNDSTYVPWQHFQTTNSTIFGTDTGLGASPPYNDTAGDKYVYFHASGAYVAMASVVWASGAYNQGMIIDSPGGMWQLNDVGTGVSTSEDLATNTSPGDFVPKFGPYSYRMFYVDGTTGPGIARLLPVQTSGGSKVVDDATMGIFYLGGTTADLGSIY